MADYGRAGGVQLQVAAGVAANIARAGGVQLHVAAAASTNEARLAGIQMEVLALGTLGAIVAPTALAESMEISEDLEAETSSVAYKTPFSSYQTTGHGIASNGLQAAPVEWKERRRR